MKLDKVYGLSEITRHNLYNSSEISGGPAPGYSSGAAIAAITEVANKKLPKGEKPQPIPALKDIKAQIQQQLVLQKQQAGAAAFVQSLRAKAQVETTLK